jgi:hypothetical protein
VSGLKEIEIGVAGAKDLALIGNDDSVWLVVPLRWWDFSTLLFWFFMPADRRATINLRTFKGEKTSFKAVRVATRHVRVSGIYK